MLNLLPLIGNIIHEGMKLWNEERRTRFMDEHFEILAKLKNAENAQGSDYCDAEIDLLKEELETFLCAYHSELSEYNMQIMGKK